MCSACVVLLCVFSMWAPHETAYCQSPDTHGEKWKSLAEIYVCFTSMFVMYLEPECKLPFIYFRLGLFVFYILKANVKTFTFITGILTVNGITKHINYRS